MQRPTSNVSQSSHEKIGLNNIPNDIQYLIASEIAKSSPSTIFALAQSSRTLRQATLPFIYRDLVLKRTSSKSGTHKAYRALIESLRNDKDHDIAKHVRNLTVKDDLPDDRSEIDLPEDDLLFILDIIAQSSALRSLIWETPSHIPASVLDKIHATWPDLELTVRVFGRHNTQNPAHRQMDVNLLSSPTLKNLDYYVYLPGRSDTGIHRSEWAKLTQALVAGGNVRVLKVNGLSYGTLSGYGKILPDTEPEESKHLDNTPGMLLPALEELIIRIQRYYGDSTYMWDADRCVELREGTDLSRLRKLDFGSELPDGFFSTFTGALPQLKSLRFGVPKHGASMVAVKGFIESIEGLESLDIDQPQSVIEELGPSIMWHKRTLKSLILRPTTRNYGHSPCYIELHHLKTISTHLPLLERLSWDAPCGSNVDDKHLDVLGTMNLRHLDLYLNLPSERSLYSGFTMSGMSYRPPTPMDVDGPKTGVTAIMDRIPTLETLTVYFGCTATDERGDPYRMFSKVQIRRDATGGDYEISGSLRWA